MESELAREREFNASSATLNTEYLVNVLRSFLMTKNGSEHAKLVPVLCSLLHFNKEETAYIIAMWPVDRGGITSWLLPNVSQLRPLPPPTNSNQSINESRPQQSWHQHHDFFSGYSF